MQARAPPQPSRVCIKTDVGPCLLFSFPSPNSHYLSSSTNQRLLAFFPSHDHPSQWPLLSCTPTTSMTNTVYAYLFAPVSSSFIPPVVQELERSIRAVCDVRAQMKPVYPPRLMDRHSHSKQCRSGLLFELFQGPAILHAPDLPFT